MAVTAGIWSGCCEGLARALLAASCAVADETAGPAEQLVRRMARERLDAIALRDPGAPARVLAARPFGRTQLTVLVREIDTPQMNAWLRAGEYGAAYRWLLGQPMSDGALVLHDLNGLGLRADREPGHGFDMVAAGEAPTIAFDGDWQAQGLSQDDYCAAFARAQHTYARTLQALLAAMSHEADPSR